MTINFGKDEYRKAINGFIKPLTSTKDIDKRQRIAKIIQPYVQSILRDAIQKNYDSLVVESAFTLRNNGVYLDIN